MQNKKVNKDEDFTTHVLKENHDHNHDIAIANEGHVAFSREPIIKNIAKPTEAGKNGNSNNK